HRLRSSAAPGRRPQRGAQPVEGGRSGDGAADAALLSELAQQTRREASGGCQLLGQVAVQGRGAARSEDLAAQSERGPGERGSRTFAARRRTREGHGAADRCPSLCAPLLLVRFHPYRRSRLGLAGSRPPALFWSVVKDTANGSPGGVRSSVQASPAHAI